MAEQIFHSVEATLSEATERLRRSIHQQLEALGMDAASVREAVIEGLLGRLDVGEPDELADDYGLPQDLLADVGRLSQLQRKREALRPNLPEKIEVDGVERPTMNSSGRAIAPSADGVRNFWRWFGNSQVIDNLGRPLVVYHGTRHDFDEFQRLGRKSKNRLHYFTADPFVANEFAGNIQHGTPNVMPVYLSATKPFLFDADGDNWGSLRIDIFPDEIAKHFDERNILRGRSSQVARIGFTDVIRSAIAAGYDGVVAENIRDGAGPYGEKNASRVVVVHAPEQIKSALGNSGSFDQENPNILYSREILLRSEMQFGISVDQIAQLIDKEFGLGFSRRIVETGAFHLVQSERELPLHLQHPDGGVSGVYDANADATYLVADWLQPDTVRGTVLHEIGVHYGLPRMLGDLRAKELADQAWQLAAEGDPAALAALRRIPIDTPNEHVREELLAYLVQDHAGRKLSLAKKVESGIKGFLFKLGASVSLDPVDMTMLAEGSLKRVASRRLSVIRSFFRNVRATLRRAASLKQRALPRQLLNAVGLAVKGRHWKGQDVATGVRHRASAQGVLHDDDASFEVAMGLLAFAEGDAGNPAIQSHKYAFAGGEAKTAPIATLSQAVAMAKPLTVREQNQLQKWQRAVNAGLGLDQRDQSKFEQLLLRAEAQADPLAITRKTGWFCGYDGRWRFEIDDSTARLNPDVVARANAANVLDFENPVPVDMGPVCLADLLSHPQLFEAYPQLGDIEVEVLPQDGVKLGQFSHSKWKITLYGEQSGDTLLSTVLHEVQHAVQAIEGFANGGNKDEVKEALSMAISSEKPYADWAQEQFSTAMLYDRAACALEMIDRLERRPLSVYRSSLYYEYGPFSLPIGGKARREALQEVAEKAKAGLRQEVEAPLAEHGITRLEMKTPAEYRAMANEVRESVPSGNKSSLRLVRRLGDLLQSLSGFALYQRLAGEVEARATEARRMLTMEERLNQAPYASQGIPDEEVIVRYLDGQVDLAASEIEHSRFQLLESKLAALEQANDGSEEMQAAIDAASMNLVSAMAGSDVEILRQTAAGCVALQVEVDTGRWEVRWQDGDGVPSARISCASYDAALPIFWESAIPEVSVLPGCDLGLQAEQRAQVSLTGELEISQC